MPRSRGSVVGPAYVSVADGKVFLGLLVAQKHRMGHLQPLVNDQAIPDLDGEIFFLMAAQAHAIKVQRAINNFTTGHRLRQQRGRLIDVLDNDQRMMSCMFGVVEIGKVVSEGKHHDFVKMPGLTFVGNGVQAGAAGGDQSLLLASDRQIAVMSQRAYSL
ncbi:hypothetical protein D3C77_613290 [compost metagenome]